MTDITPILPKVQKLIRLFMSDKEAEAFSALRKLGQVLASAGADFHDLAAAVGGEEKEPELPDYGNEFWNKPKPKSNRFDDFFVPKRWKPAPRASGPPLWELLKKNARLAWLERAIEAEILSQERRQSAAEVRARFFSQPHVKFRPAEASQVNSMFAELWLADLRPIADLAAGDKRLPLRWEWTNREQVRAVLQRGFRVFDHKDGVFAVSVIRRIEESPHGLSQISVDERERIEQLLVEAYDAGARP